MASFDIVGDIAIIEVGSEEDEKGVVESILEKHPHLKTICCKAGEREGELRLRKIKILFTKDKEKPTETIHKEYGCLFKVDVSKVYFSPREGTERQRVARQVKPGETVLVMFAGVGPYAIIIAKVQPEVKRVYAVEVNKVGVKYMKENVDMNRMRYKVIPIEGDVARDVKQFHGVCDRVVMPLPKGAHRFLQEAIRCCKDEGIIHFYHWGPLEDLYGGALEIIEGECKRAGVGYEVLDKRRVLPYAPRVYKVCIDFKVKRCKA